MSYLKLVYSRDNLARWVAEKLLEMADLEVGHPNVLHLSGFRQLLHFLPASGQL